MIDYHIHTPLCNHAQGSMELYVHHAVRVGMKEICFLDHLTLNEYGRKYSMGIREVPLYFQAVQSIKRRFRDRITIRAGLEIDFHPDAMPIVEEIKGKFAFDVIGGSVHFVNNINIASRREAKQIKKSDIGYLVEGYFEQVNAMLDYDFFDFICHLDIVKKTGLLTVSENFDAQIDSILSKIARKDIPVEINSSGWEHPANEPYPSKTLIDRCFSKNIPIVIGSDAHLPETIGKFYNKTLGILSSAGYTEVCVFRNRVRHTIEIS